MGKRLEIEAADKSTFAAPASSTSGPQSYDLEGSGSRTKRRRKRKPTGEPVTKESEMDLLNLFIPITKIDAAKRLVYGVATAEKPDVAKEICDYASTKPLYQKWSDGFAKTTDGKSLGNLRAMHGNVAAGKITEIAFNDDAKQIEVCGKVVDDAEWAKVEEGVYTGFSQGGRYVKRWPDPADSKLTRYTAEPLEVSLVDSPCLPDATFSVVKADGTTEMRKFKTVAQPAAAAAAASSNPEDGDWEQVWVSKRLPGKEFKAKAELRQALVDLDAEEAAKKAAGPVLDALGAIKAKLDGDSEIITAAHIETVQKFMAANVGHELTARARAVFEKGDPNQTAELRKELREIIAAMDAKVAPQPTAADLTKKDYSAEERKQGAKEGWAKKDGSYPIKTADDVANAVKDWIRSKGSASDKRHIIKRAKALKATDKLPSDWSGSTQKDDAGKAAGDELGKQATLYSISNLLLLLDSVQQAEDYAESDSWGFGPSVELPKELTDRFGTALVELGDIAVEMLDVVLGSIKEEEAGEALAAAARIVDLQKLTLAKAGAKHSKADKERIRQAHDALAALDPDCCDAEDGEDDDAEKLAKQLNAEREANGKLLNDTILPMIKGLAEQLDAVGKSVKTIAEQPLPMGTSSVTLRVVEKTQDGAPGRGAGSTEALEQLADRALAEARSGKTAAA